MDMVRRTHHLAKFHLCQNAFFSKADVFRTDTKSNISIRRIFFFKRGACFWGKGNYASAKKHGIFIAPANKPCGEKVHLRCADKSRDKNICRAVKNFLRGADLLNNAVLHNNHSVTKGHGFCLVVCNVNKSGIQLLAQLYYFGTHLASKLCIKVGKRLVHKKKLWFAHNGPANGNTLALSAGKSLWFSAKIFRKAKNLCRFAHFFIDLFFGSMAHFKAEGHVIINVHVRKKRIVLKNHGNITLFRSKIVYPFGAYVNVAGRWVFKSGNYAQGGGFSAAGRTDQNNKFLIRNLDGKIPYGGNAFFGILRVIIFFGFFFFRGICPGKNFCYVNKF